MGNLHIELCDALVDIYHQQHHVGLFDGDIDLTVDLALKGVVRIDHPSSGVDDGELLTAPFGVAVLAVACSARLVHDDSTAGLSQTVE